MDLNFWKKDNSGSDEQTERSVKQPDMEYRYADDNDGSSESSGVVHSPEYYQPEPADPEKARPYNNISRWAVYVGVFLLPLFFLPWTSNVLETNKQILLLVVAGVGLVSWLLGVVSSGYLAWRVNSLDKGILAFLATLAVTAVFSVAKFKSVFGLGNSLSNALASIVGLTVVYFLVVNNSEDKGKTLRSLAGLSIILALLYGLLQIFGVYVFRFAFSTSRTFNTVGSINVLGVLAAVGLPLFSKARLDLGWLKKAHLEKVGVVLSMVLLVILNWWVLWAVAIAGMVAMIVFENLSGGKFRIAKLLLPMTVVVVGVFMLVVNLNFNVLKRNLPVEVSPSFTLSKDVATSVFKEKPVFGYGPENFSVAFDKYGAGRLANSTLSNAVFFDATSEVLTLLVNGGLITTVGLAFLLFCVGLLFWRFKEYAAKNQNLETAKEDVGVLASLAAIIAATFLYPLNLTLMTFLYLFMGLAVLIIFEESRKEFNIEEKTSLSLGSSLGFIGGLILVLVGIYFGATLYISDVKYAKAVTEGDNAKAAGLLVEAINWNNQDERHYRAASQTALKLLAEEVNKKAGPERDSRIQNHVTTSISLAKRATELAPKEAITWANLGFIYQNLLNLVDGVDKLSEDAYLKALELRPGDPIFNYRIGMMYLAKFDRYGQLVAARRVNSNAVFGDAQAALSKAEENLKKASELSSNFGLAIYNLGVIYERQGRLNEAIRQLEKVAPANSNQPGLAFELGLLYYRAGRKNDAFNAMQRAVVLAPDYSNARWYLALIFEERGDLDSAVQQLERILSVDVNKDSSIVTRKLDELRAGKTSIPPGDVLDQEPLQ